jgi:hypothetical protein
MMVILDGLNMANSTEEVCLLLYRAPRRKNIIIEETMLTYEAIRTKSQLVYMRHQEYHRKDGPARIWHDGDEEYWMRGEQC